MHDRRSVTPTGNVLVDLVREDLANHEAADERGFASVRGELRELREETQGQSVALVRIETKLSSASWIITTAIAAAGVVIGLLAAHAAHL
jgi:hypothetical protein